MEGPCSANCQDRRSRAWPKQPATTAARQKEDFSYSRGCSACPKERKRSHCNASCSYSCSSTTFVVHEHSLYYRQTGVRIWPGPGPGPGSLIFGRGRGHGRGRIFHLRKGLTKFREYTNLNKTIPISPFHNHKIFHFWKGQTEFREYCNLNKPIPVSPFHNYRILHYWNRHVQTNK